jgi:hypothetical protein
VGSNIPLGLAGESGGEGCRDRTTDDPVLGGRVKYTTLASDPPIYQTLPIQSVTLSRDETHVRRCLKRGGEVAPRRRKVGRTPKRHLLFVDPAIV